MRDRLSILGFIILWGALLLSSCSGKQEKVEEFPDNYSGIGVELEIVGDYPQVVTVFQGGPADEGGLKQGDVVIAVNDVSTKKMGLGDIVMMLRGPTGSQVVLTVTGKDRPPRLILPIKRGNFKRVNTANGYQTKEKEN